MPTPPTGAGTPAVGTTLRTDATAINRDAIAGLEEIRYNQLPEGLLFRYRLLERNDQIFNGGLGDGLNMSYFCGGQDEADALNALNGLERRYVPNSGAGNEGSYEVIRVEDRCRLEGGCGSIVPDGKSFVIGFPKYKTNCQIFKKGYYDQEAFTTASPSDSSSTGNPFNPMYPAWQARSRGGDFLFSRYLVNQIAVNIEENDPQHIAYAALYVGLNRPSSPHHLDSASSNYLDLASDPAHLAWGFTCGEICKAGGYRNNPAINCREGINLQVGGGPTGALGTASQAPITLRQTNNTASISDQEFLDYHKKLLETAVNKLGNDIIAGSFGNLSAPRETLTSQQKGMRETVVTIWHVLKTMLDDGVYWETCDGATCRIARTMGRIISGRHPLELRRCEGLPRDIKVELRHEDRILCLSPEIVDDCQAKRSMGSLSAFNSSGGCEPSYGEWDGSGSRRGIREPKWGTRRGYVLSTTGAGNGEEYVSYVTAYETPKISSNGWAPFATAMIAHQLVHDYYQKTLGRNRIVGWPNSHDALWEEETAVEAQALVFYALQQEGYAPVDFAPQKEPIIPTVQTRALTLPGGGTAQQVTGGTDGVRYSFNYEPRGYRGIYLGPQFASLRNISRDLYETNNPEEARMMALLYSMAPILHLPTGTVRDGVITEAAATTAATPGLPGGDTGAAGTGGSDSQADMRVSVARLSRTELSPGRYRFTSDISVENLGPNSTGSQNTLVSIRIPSGLDFLITCGSGEYTHNEGSRSHYCGWSEHPIGPGSSETIHFTAVQPSPGSDATIRIHVIEELLNDPNPDNNTIEANLLELPTSAGDTDAGGTDTGATATGGSDSQADLRVSVARLSRTETRPGRYVFSSDITVENRGPLSTSELVARIQVSPNLSSVHIMASNLGDCPRLGAGPGDSNVFYCRWGGRLIGSGSNESINFLAIQSASGDATIQIDVHGLARDPDERNNTIEVNLLELPTTE